MADEKIYRVFWLNGMAGTGKSTIADSLVRYARSEGIFGAAFFCSRYFETARDINRIFPLIAFQLSYRHPEYRNSLLDAPKTMEYIPISSSYSLS